MKYLIAFLAFFASHASAQTTKLYNQITNDVRLIHSRILNEDRQLYIHVPTLDSVDVEKPMDVFYLLDGENHFQLLSAYVEYLRHWQVIPPVIVVGIVSVDRVKDLTPTNSLINFDGQVDYKYKTSGGNEKFLSFIQHELMPYIDAHYKSSGFKILGGHSFGGITAINCMLSHSQLFDAYIAVSPSLWFDNKHVLRLAQQKLRGLAIGEKKIFYSVGNEDGTFREDVLAFNKLITSDRSGKLEHEFKKYLSESHMTEPVPAYYEALRFIYKNWSPDIKK